MNLKKIFITALALLLLFGFTACDSVGEVTPLEPDGEDEEAGEAAGDQEEVELIVFAAASMTEVLEEINKAFTQENPHVKVTLNLDSSGTLKTQIEEGAQCDIFISAAQKAMNELDISADPEVNTGGLDFILEETRKNILENKVVLTVPQGNPKDVNSYDDLAELLVAGDILLAMGNIDVPVGQYTSNILVHYGLDEEALAGSGVITYASTVKEVTTQVAEGLVDCGIIYSTDAKAAGLEVVDEATSEMTGSQVIYPAAVIKDSLVTDVAKAYLDFLTGSEGARLLEEFGFTPTS